MEKKLFKNIHYNTPGHAHELTFSAYRRQNVFLEWSSAYARSNKDGVIPDKFNMPVAMPNAQDKRISVV